MLREINNDLSSASDNENFEKSSVSEMVLLERRDMVNTGKSYDGLSGDHACRHTLLIIGVLKE